MLSVVCEKGLVCVWGVCVFVVEAFDHLPQLFWVGAEGDRVKCLFPSGLLFVSDVLVNFCV